MFPQKKTSGAVAGGLLSALVRSPKNQRSPGQRVFSQLIWCYNPWIREIQSRNSGDIMIEYDSVKEMIQGQGINHGKISSRNRRDAINKVLFNGNHGGIL